MTRTFLAADLDAGSLEVAAQTSAAVRGLTKLRASWVRPEVMHVTLRFFGDVDDERLVHLRAMVPALLESPRSPAVRALRVDAFPNVRRARVLVLPLEDDGTLARAAAAAEARAVSLGFEAETRTFRPHLTLARFKEPGDIRALVEAARPLLDGRVVSLTLYASTLGSAGPTYTPLATMPLAE